MKLDIETCIVYNIDRFLFLLCADFCRLFYSKQLTYSLYDHRAVLDHSVGKELPAVAVESFECLPGRGVTATLSGVKVCVDLMICFNQQPSGNLQYKKNLPS